MQLALTPVFLLSGIAALLNVFVSRFARVADQTHAWAAQPKDTPGRDQRLSALRWRSHALQAAIVLAAVGGALTSATVLVLFLAGALGAGAAGLLFLMFGAALVLTIGALVAFVAEMLLAARGVRRSAAASGSASPPSG